jgi:FkbM family methyltransferase
MEPVSLLSMILRELKAFLLKRFYATPAGRKRLALEKRQLRREVSEYPIGPGYPHEVEAKLLRAIRLPLSPMLDVGANTGFYSAVMEDIVGSDNLFLVEPLPELSGYLRQKFPGTQVSNVALSERSGSQEIRVPYVRGVRFQSRASLNDHVEPEQTDSEVVVVTLTTLDDLIQDLGLTSLGFVKIDVEGHELSVINGALDTFSRLKPLILMEVEARHHEYSITKVFEKLNDLGYRGYFIDPVALRLMECDQFDPEIHQNPELLIDRDFFGYLNNFFFVPPSILKEFIGETESFLLEEQKYLRAAG